MPATIFDLVMHRLLEFDELHRSGDTVYGFPDYRGRPSDGALFLYPGEQHLFADSSLPSHDQASSAVLTKRVLRFLQNA